MSRDIAKRTQERTDDRRLMVVNELLRLSPRVECLRRRLEAAFAASGGHRLTDAGECECYARLAVEAYSRTTDRPEIIRRAEFLRRFAENIPVTRHDDELIVGSQRFTAPPFQQLFDEEQLRHCGIHRNHGHIIVDYGRVLRLGVDGLRRDVAAMPADVNREAFGLALDAFAVFVRRHGFAELSTRPPKSFAEALQLTWFIQIFLSAEGLASAISFGRLDQFLWPYLEADLATGTCTREQAFELVCCFFIKCCDGGESQNLTVGGPGENPLSLLLLRAMRELKVWQPSLSVRIAPDSSEEFWREALELCATGIGMPSFFNDPVVTAALARLDIPAERVADWGIVGCYEAAPQGDACPYTVAGGFALPEILYDYLQTSAGHVSFEDFLASFKDYFSSTYRGRLLPEFAMKLRKLEVECISPFESLCVTGCVASGRAAEQGGARCNLFGVNILGLGTLVDSLLAIKILVFDEQVLGLPELAEQLEHDFADESLRQRCRSLPGKFGADTPASNGLARDLSRFVAAEILDSRLPNGYRPYPGFFWFGQDIHRQVSASPDGRHAGERVSYGCGPGIMLEKPSATAILNSASHVAHALCACGNPLTLSFNRGEISGADGISLLRQVVEAYFAIGGGHLHFNILDVKDLEQAKANPELHPALTVRISGFSARFVALGEKWQEAIIERTARGI